MTPTATSSHLPTGLVVTPPGRRSDVAAPPGVSSIHVKRAAQIQLGDGGAQVFPPLNVPYNPRHNISAPPWNPGLGGTRDPFLPNYPSYPTFPPGFGIHPKPAETYRFGLSKGAVIGVGVGVPLLALAVFTGAVLYFRHRAARPSQPMPHDAPIGHADDLELGGRDSIETAQSSGS